MNVQSKMSGTSKTARMISVELGSSASACVLSFSYYKHKGSFGTTSLEIIIRSNSGSETSMWYVLDDMGDMWHNQTIGIGEQQSGWKLIVEAGHYDTEGDIMIDDIHFYNCSRPESTLCKNGEYPCLNGVCVDESQVCDFNDDCGDYTDEVPTLCSSYPEMCNYEDGFCNWWTPDDNGTFGWMRKTGEMLAEDVGPDYDHTYGNETGYYMYLMSGHGDGGKVGRIYSAGFHPAFALEHCHFRFWYMMRAHHNATLTVYAVETSTSAKIPPKNLYQTSGSEDYMWVRVDVRVKFSRAFRILLEGKVGDEFTGDIAVDDVSFTSDCKPLIPTTTSPPPNQCQDGEFQCESGECIPDQYVCDFRYDCPDSSDEYNCYPMCNFEVDMCDWHEVVEDALDWVWAQANDSMYGTDQGGPYTDADGLRTGHFLLLHKTKADLSNEEGFAVSHFHQNTAPYCRYSYHFYMSGVLWSNVVLRLYTSPSDFTNLTFFTGNMGADEGKWTKGEVGIGHQEAPFQLSLYKEPFRDYEGKFAFDTTMYDNNCHYPDPSPDGCQVNEFHCTKTQVSTDHSTI